MKITAASFQMNPRGFSLLEVITATALFAILMAAAMVMATSSSNRVEETVMVADLENRGEIAITTMIQDLEHGTELSVLNGSTSIIYQIPMDLDGNGTVLDVNGNLEYGATSPVGEGVGVMTISYIQTSVLNEAEVFTDLNNDGDQVDQFDLGYLQRVSTIEGDQPTRIGDAFIAQPRNNWGADITGDGVADPIFNFTNSRLTINLYLMQRSNNGRAYLVRTNSSVFLRNQ